VKPLLRLLLVCYLLLALPFQAFASASMLPLAAPAQLPPCHQQMAGDHMAGGHMAMSGMKAAGDSQAGQHGKAKSGACAACCVGAALAPGLPVPLALAPPRFVSIPFRAGYLPSVDPVLLERPPSTLPA
jgi:hypothetical protein